MESAYMASAPPGIIQNLNHFEEHYLTFDPTDEPKNRIIQSGGKRIFSGNILNGGNSSPFRLVVHSNQDTNQGMPHLDLLKGLIHGQSLMHTSTMLNRWLLSTIQPTKNLGKNHKILRKSNSGMLLKKSWSLFNKMNGKNIIPLRETKYLKVAPLTRPISSKKEPSRSLTKFED